MKKPVAKTESFGQRMAKLRASKKGGKKVVAKKDILKPGDTKDPMMAGGKKPSAKAMAFLKKVGMNKK